MRFLLDTHTFLWMEDNQVALSSTALELISDLENEIFLSYVSIWEIQIKLTIGKLKGKDPLVERVITAQTVSGLYLLPIAIEHIYLLNNLPLHHRDPFDRMLVAQSISEGLPILSRDSVLAQYPVKIIW